MDEKQLKAIVEAEFSTALGAPDGDISKERAEAWNYYLSRKLGNEVDGMSEVVSSDVAEVIDGYMPSLLRLFTSADNLCHFDPVGPEDIAFADQQTEYVNHVFFKKNPAFETMFYWFFDALVQKNGVVMAWWDESEKVTTENYSGLDEMQVSELLDDEELEAVSRSETEVTNEDGTVEVLHNVEFRRVSKSGKVVYECVPPEEYRISGDSRSLDPCKSRMVGREKPVPRSDLIDMGYNQDLVYSLPTYLNDTKNSPERIARRHKEDERFDRTYEASQEEVLVRMAYIKVDFDGDGRSELRYVMTAGNEILENEPVDRQPFHVLCPQPLPHKHFGLSIAEKVMDIQEKNTSLERGILDNIYHTNNPGHAVWEEAIGDDTLDDLLTTRVGRVARFDRPVGESYSPMTVPFTAASSFQILDYYEKRKRDRTGVGADSDGLDPMALKNIQQSVMNASTDIAKMKVEAVARIFAETGIKSLFLHIHELLLKHQKKADVFRLRNEWVPVDPSAWKTREDVTVNIGLGHATREQNLMHLTAIKDLQAQIIGGGGAGVLVDPKHVYNTAAEFVKNANLKDPSLYFKDPGDQGFQQPGDESQEQQMQMIQRQQELDAQDNQIQAQKLALQQERDSNEVMLKQEKIISDMQKHAEEMQFKYEEQENKMLIEMEKMATKLAELETNTEEEIEFDFEYDPVQRRLVSANR
jgi:hypothetical protein